MGLSLPLWGGALWGGLGGNFGCLFQITLSTKSERKVPSLPTQAQQTLCLQPLTRKWWPTGLFCTPYAAPVQHNTTPVQHNAAPVQHNTAPVQHRTDSAARQQILLLDHK